MHARKRILASFLALVAFLVTIGAASAESVQAILNKGNRLFAQGDYAAAFDVFKEGYEKSPTPVFLSSMAFCQLKLFNHEKARTFLLEYIKKFPKVTDNQKMKELASGLEVVVQTRLSVTTDPPGAELYIDAEAAGKVGMTPFKGTLEPGKHTLILRGAGYAVTTKTFSINPKENLALKIPLEVPCKVASNPVGATVRVDSEKGEPLGKTPLSATIVPGRRVLFLEAPGYLTWKREITVAAKVEFSLEAQLEVGLKIASNPTGAGVAVDGKAMPGKTPLEIPVVPAKHTVVVSLAGFKPAQREVEAAPGKSSDLLVQLEGSMLTMRTDVPGADVKIGALEVGKTPIERATVPMGSQAVAVTHPDRRPWSHAIQFSGDEAIQAEVKLGRPLWPVWTAGGVGVAGLLLGTIAGVVAMKRTSEANDKGWCTSDGIRTPAGDVAGAKCGYVYHNLSTAAFITGGVAVGVALVYYLVWGRSSEKITRTHAAKVATTATPVAATPVAATQ
jgi:hypothetical protein